MNILLSIEIADRQKVKLFEKRKSVHHLQMQLQRRPTVAVQGSCHTKLQNLSVQKNHLRFF